jgi:hypothetical protein
VSAILRAHASHGVAPLRRRRRASSGAASC